MPNIDQAIGERVRTYRKALGMSQTDLAERIGVRFQQVQKYENGSNRIAASRLWQIAEALGVPVNALFETVPGMSPDNHARTSEIIEVVRDLPPQRQSEALSLLRKLAANGDFGPE